MKNKWIIVLITVLLLIVFSLGLTVLFMNKEISSTVNQVSSQFAKIIKPMKDTYSLNEELSKVKGIKTVRLTIGFNVNSSGRTNYIAVIVSLRKGYVLKNVANDLVKVIIEKYPDYRKKDVISIVERNELNLDFFHYSRDIETISRSPKEWEESID